MDKSGWVQPVYESFVSDGGRRRSSRARPSRKMTTFPRESVHSRRDSDPDRFMTADEAEGTDTEETDTEEQEAPVSSAPPPPSQTPPSTNTSEEKHAKPSKPTCSIRLAGGRYKKEIELTLDSQIDDVIYRVLKCLDDECVDINGLQVKGKKNPMIFLQHFLAPFASCFSYKPTTFRPKRRPCVCRCSKPKKSSGERKSMCADSDESDNEAGKSSKRKKKRRRKSRRSPCGRLLKKCRRSVRCVQSCCQKDDVVLIEICPSQTTDTDVKYKKQKERGVGTDTSPELEILLRGENLHCVAKRTGAQCRCRNCCPKSKKKAAPDKASTREETFEEESDGNVKDSRQTNDSDYSDDAGRRNRSTRSDSRGKLSFERAYSLLVNRNDNPVWQSGYDSTSEIFSNGFDAPRATMNQRPVRWRVGKPQLLYNIKSEPFNVYSALEQTNTCYGFQGTNLGNLKHHRKKLFDPRLEETRQDMEVKNRSIPVATTSHKRKSKLFFGSDYILELHETSESAEETLRDQNTKCQTDCISDYLRLHKLFQRSQTFKMNLTSSNSQTLSSSSADKAKKPNKEHEPETNSVLGNEYSAGVVFTKVTNLHSTSSIEHPSATSLPKEEPQLKSSKPIFLRFPPSKKSTNLLAFLKNLKSGRRLSKNKTKVVVDGNVKTNQSFSHLCARNFEKLKIYLRLSRKSKTNAFSPVTLNKKQAMINLSSLISDSL